MPPAKRSWSGTLQKSLQLLTGLHVSANITESVGDTNDFLDSLQGKQVRITIEEFP